MHHPLPRYPSSTSFKLYSHSFGRHAGKDHFVCYSSRGPDPHKRQMKHAYTSSKPEEDCSLQGCPRTLDRDQFLSCRSPKRRPQTTTSQARNFGQLSWGRFRQFWFANPTASLTSNAHPHVPSPQPSGLLKDKLSFFFLIVVGGISRSQHDSYDHWK